MPFQELISSLNPAITNLLAEKNKEMTRSIISLDGTGHYLTLSAAITAGEKYILLKDGEHSISSNITISDQKITGESKRNTILKFTNNSKLIFDSTGNIVNEGGSGTYEIKLAQDDDLITKAGTQDLGFTAVDYDNSWRQVTYGNGIFVAVAYTGTNNRVMTSPDGITWTSRTSAADNDWESVIYGNSLFVAVADSGTNNRVMTSPDGITWTSKTSAADNNWESVIYGNSLFVAVADTGTNNRVMTSTDGTTWTSRSSAADNGWDSVTYGNSLFVAVAYTGTSNRVMTSTDGIIWTLRNLHLKTRLTFESYNLRVDSIADTNNLNIKNIVPGRIDDLSNVALEIFPYNMGNYTSNGAEISNLTINYFSTASASDINCIEMYGYNHKIIEVNFISINNDTIFINIVPSFTNKKICANILIESCVFEGGLTAIKATRFSNSLIKKNQFQNQKGTIFDGENGNYVRDLIFEQNNFTHGFRGVFLDNETKNITFKYNNFLYIEQSAILADDGATTEAERNLVIKANKFIQCGELNTNKGERETIITPFDGTTISNNTFEKCYGAIRAKVTTADPIDESLIITGNIFKECQATVYSECKGAIIKNNVFITCELTNILAFNDPTIQGNQIINPDTNTPISGTDLKIIGNQFSFTTERQISFTGNDSIIIGNWFENVSILISADRDIFKGNQIRNVTDGFAITITGDQNLLSINFLKDCKDGLDIQATADKTNALENIWHTITTTAYQNNGTNTVASNNITV